MDMRLEVVVVPVPDADRADPDGNGWYVQEITTRLPGRTAFAEAGRAAGS